MSSFNIKEIVARAFVDYIGPPFPTFKYDIKVGDGKIKVKKKGHKIDLLAINKNQLLGEKYFLTLELSHKGKRYKMPNEPLISLGVTKTIVETATVGKYRKGTVKEYICTEDYTISIRGVCINLDDPEAYPAEQVQVLNDLFEINEAVQIESNPFFELFGIRKIVLKDIQFEDMVGESGVQKYTISAVSDQDFYADLNEKDKEKTNLLA